MVEIPVEVIVTQEERERVYNLCCRSQRGEGMTRHDSVFLARMYHLHPVEYKEVHAEAWNANAEAICSTRRRATRSDQ